MERASTYVRIPMERIGVLIGPNGRIKEGIEKKFNVELQIDQNVRFRDGPFSELIGKVQNFDSKGRVKLLLELMGRAVLVMTSSSKLTAT